MRYGTTTRNSGGGLRKGIKIVVHPEFNKYTDNNDIALLKLDRQIWFDSKTKSIPIAYNLPSIGAMAKATGWGRTSVSIQLPSSVITVSS